MMPRLLTNINRFTTVIIKSGNEVRCPCGQKLAEALISGETWFTCRSCKEKVKAVTQ